VIPMLLALKEEEVYGSRKVGRGSVSRVDITSCDIILECRNPELEGQQFYLHQGRNLIGRSEQCHIKIEDGSVSRMQALIVVTSRGVLLQDLKTTNGTQVQGEFVNSTEIKNGDVIEFGKTKYEVIFRIKSRGRKYNPNPNWNTSFDHVLDDKTEVIHFESFQPMSKRTFGLKTFIYNTSRSKV